MLMISGKTGLYCLLGSPVAHSLSPAMHNLSFQALCIDSVYVAFDVGKDSAEQAAEAIRTLGILGCNLTMPLKTAILPYLDELSDAARLCGSVNTIENRNGRLIGHTTDGAGFMRAMTEHGIDFSGAAVTLLGAGGAAKSICTQAALDGVARIHLMKRKNQTFDTAVSFARKVTEETRCLVTAEDLNDRSVLSSALSDSRILINATSVGMDDGTDHANATPVDPSLLSPHLTVCDVIYHPTETHLLSDAKKAGCKTMNGSDMLLFQGACSFELWTGRKMPVDLVRKTLG